jgi:anti-sigma factor RsiW
MIHPGDLLSAYLDGELTAQERNRVEGHAASCDGCRNELEGLMTVRSQLRSLLSLDVAPELLGLPARSARPAHRHRRVLVGAAAAAAAVVMVAATLTAPDNVVSVSIGDLASPLDARISDSPALVPGQLVPIDSPEGEG